MQILKEVIFNPRKQKVVPLRKVPIVHDLLHHPAPIAITVLKKWTPEGAAETIYHYPTPIPPALSLLKPSLQTC